MGKLLLSLLHKPQSMMVTYSLSWPLPQLGKADTIYMNLIRKIKGHMSLPSYYANDPIEDTRQILACMFMRQ